MNPLKYVISFSVFFLLFLGNLPAQENAKRYIFYMHGAWLEKNGPRKAHPHHGMYHYDEIVGRFESAGFEVISEIRSETEPEDYANKVADQMEALLNQGVPPENITVMGHSKGGHMAMIVSSLWNEPEFSYIVLAGCGKQGTPFRRGFAQIVKGYSEQMTGHLLSIYDSADRISASCKPAFIRAQDTSRNEIVLETGLGHGVFYQPHAAWVDEVLNWLG